MCQFSTFDKQQMQISLPIPSLSVVNIIKFFITERTSPLLFSISICLQVPKRFYLRQWIDRFTYRLSSSFSRFDNQIKAESSECKQREKNKLLINFLLLLSVEVSAFKTSRTNWKCQVACFLNLAPCYRCFRSKKQCRRMTETCAGIKCSKRSLEKKN